MASILPPVRAALERRYLFNFRMPARVFQRMVPVNWLPPQLIDGQAIISFCTLQLRNITVAPLPTVVGLSILSCAYRFAVLDTTQPVATPAVYVPARYTNNRFGSWFTYQGFSCPHPLIQATISTQAGTKTLSITHADGAPLFDAVFADTDTPQSTLFDTADRFASFIKAGVTSYGNSIRGTQLTRVDLRKTETAFTPLVVHSWQDQLLSAQDDGEIVLDSAFSTAGGQYQWTYHGLVAAEQPVRALVPVR